MLCLYSCKIKFILSVAKKKKTHFGVVVLNMSSLPLTSAIVIFVRYQLFVMYCLRFLPTSSGTDPILLNLFTSSRIVLSTGWFHYISLFWYGILEQRCVLVYLLIVFWMWMRIKFENLYIFNPSEHNEHKWKWVFKNIVWFHLNR